MWGTIRSGEGHVAHLRTQLTLRKVDLMDPVAMREFCAEMQPDYIFHLAAQAFVPRSWEDPWATLENNVRAQLNVLEVAVHLNPMPRVLVVGSADEYGLVYPSELPIRETNPLRPYSPYAVSKVAQDLLGYQYAVSYKLPAVRVRPFNHLGPRQSDAFVASSFARQIAEAEVGQREPVVYVGNLSARRDFSDVRDIVRGYYLAITMGEPGEVYNLGSEQSHSIQELLAILRSLSKVAARVEQDPARTRPSDVPEILSDCSKFRALTGWRAEIPFERTLADVLDDWRAKVRRQCNQ